MRVATSPSGTDNVPSTEEVDGLLAFPPETKVLVPASAIRPASGRPTPPPQRPRTAEHEIRRPLSPFLLGVMVGLGCVALLVPTPPRPTTPAAPIGGAPVAAAAPLAPATAPSPAAAPTPVALAPARPGPQTPSSVASAPTPVAFAPGRPALQTPSQPPAVPTENPAVPPRRIQTDFRGSLEVGSSPQGAQVFLNGVPVGTTPIVLRDLPVGSRALRVELDGYKHWSSTVQIMASEQARIMATLPASLTP